MAGIERGQPGCIGNPSNPPLTACREILRGIAIPERLHHPGDAMIDRRREAAGHLEKQGLRAIPGSGGFLAVFQRGVAEAVPAFLSSLIHRPMGHRMICAPVHIPTVSAARALCPDCAPSLPQFAGLESCILTPVLSGAVRAG